MKVRKGFVSNSSSSSFLIGIGKVVDEEKLRNHLDKIREWDYDVVSVKDLKEGNSDAHYRDGVAKVESFMWTDVSMDVSNMNESDKVFVLYHSCGDECDFWKEDWEDYDYDIDLDFFSKSIQDLCTTSFDELGLANFEYEYGAGRNG